MGNGLRDFCYYRVVDVGSCTNTHCRLHSATRLSLPLHCPHANTDGANSAMAALWQWHSVHGVTVTDCVKVCSSIPMPIMIVSVTLFINTVDVLKGDRDVRSLEGMFHV